MVNLTYTVRQEGHMPDRLHNRCYMELELAAHSGEHMIRSKYMQKTVSQGVCSFVDCCRSRKGS